MLKISKTDQIILTALGFNARISESELARRCRKSKDTIRYRIHRLEQAGIITGYSILLDYTKLGAANYKIYIQTQRQAELLAFFDTKPQVFARFSAYADWNTGVALFCKTQQEYYAIESELFTRFGKDIKQVTLCHMMHARLFAWRAYSTIRDEIELFGDITATEIDAMDRQLLNELLKDGRQTFVRLALTLKTNVNMVRRRLAALEQAGIIAAYTAHINTSLLGYENYKLFITVKDYVPDIEISLLESLASTPQCLNIVKMLGPWKIEAEFSCKNYDEFHAILRTLQEHPAVLGLRYAIFRDERYFPSGEVLH